MIDPLGTVAPPQPPSAGGRGRGTVLLVLVIVVLVAGMATVLIRDEGAPPARPRATTVPGGALTTTTAPAATVDAELATALASMRDQVEAIRGLPWKSEIPVRIVSRPELARRVQALTTEEFDRRSDELAAGEAILKLLGLVPDGVNYRRTLEDLFSGGVLGYYDDRTKELLVGAGRGALSVYTRSTLVHELTHALSDQHFDFGSRIEALDDQGRTEESVAFLALVEGDAETVRILWEQRHLDEAERSSLAAGDPDLDLSVFGRTPPYLVASLLFPYTSGTAFVDGLRRAGGFAAVDAAYQRPPVSTAEILHPARYAADDTPPAAPPLDPFPQTCRTVDEGTLGEFDMRSLLDEELPGAEAARAADGWVVDGYALVRCGSRDALVDRWTARDDADGAELTGALARWARAWSGSPAGPAADGRFSGPGGAGRIRRAGSQVELVVADDAATAALVAGPGAP